MSHAFDDDDGDITSQKSSVKQVSSQKSILDNVVKKPSSENFAKKIKEVTDKNNGYKQEISDLTAQFMKIMADKTLKENKNLFSAEYEKETLSKIIQFASKINNDPNEEEGIGSLSLIALLLKIVVGFRDKNNILEYKLQELQSKINSQIK